ncbi:MAG: ribosomal protein L7/L12 [Pirellulales bacterium]
MAPDKLDNEILNLLAAGKKIAAIKRYREATGAGLAEAKEAVERIERSELTAPEPSADSDLETQIVSLLGRGEKIAAVRLYRERTRTGLKESKEAVDAIGRQHGITVPAGSGCLGVFVLLAVLVTGITLVLAAMKF